MAAAAADSAPASLYVGDLGPDVSEAVLYEIFNAIGPVGTVRICRDAVSRRSLGYGYVNYINAQHAQAAIDKLNYNVIKGRSCRIMFVERDASKRASPKGNIFIQNLASSIDNKALHETFKQFGKIVSCKVATTPGGQSLGYGFVHFQEESDAKEAIQKVNGMEIEGNMVAVTEHKPVDKGSSDVNNFTNLYAKHFPDDWDEAKLRETFEPHGAIRSICLMDDSKSRKFAFISFQTHDSAKAAIAALHQKDLRTVNKQTKDSEVNKEMTSEDLFYVQRQQTKAERQREALKTWTAEGALKAQAKGAGKGKSNKGMGKGKAKQSGQNMMAMMPTMMPQVTGKGGMPMMMMMNPQMMGKGMPMMPGMMMPGMMPNKGVSKGASFANKVNTAAPDQQKQMLGEKLYPQIAKSQPDLAGKITGMLLEMDNHDLLMLVSSKAMLDAKISEAIAVLKP